MKRLLYHTSEFKVDWLDPESYFEKAICFSEGTFISSLGHWLYIFDFDHLKNHFYLEQKASGGQAHDWNTRYAKYYYESQKLGLEFRVKERIHVPTHALGVAENFNVLKGVLRIRLKNHIHKKEIEEGVHL